MIKKILLFSMLLSSYNLFAQNQDSLKGIDISEIVVSSNSKETNSLRTIPSAKSEITPKIIENRKIESIKDLSSIVPNLFIPDYGSSMTTPIYLRGMGNRSTGQLVGIYVDNVPYNDMSAFDFAFNGIDRVEVLRGAQGTLYGRNAMGGIINIYTKSPLDYQGLKFSVGLGNYGAQQYKISNLSKIGDNLGIAVNGYYTKRDGYFINDYSGEKADYEKSAGLNLKLDWRISDSWKAKFSTSFDYVDEGAYPYGIYDAENDVINNVNYNDEGSYNRKLSNNNLQFEYRSKKLLFTSNSGVQILRDDMWMDQDYTVASMFNINQQKTLNSYSQEFALRSLNSGNYQWSVGMFGFYDDLTTTADITFGQYGVQMLQSIFSMVMPSTVTLTLTDSDIFNPGTYITPNVGGAIFHQSTFNNLLTDGLSLTVGGRLDYEKQKLDYYTAMTINGNVEIENVPEAFATAINPVIEGDLNQDFVQFLPKVALKYEFSDDAMAYATVSKGYKAGGYNIQMFSYVIQSSLMSTEIPGVSSGSESTTDMDSQVSYSPETSWNYELGYRASMVGGRLKSDIALFYMDVDDVQITQFVDGGTGRVLSNAGEARSIGAELSLTAIATTDLTFDLNYGYTNAKFTTYNDGSDDYTGNYIPYTPQNTFSLGATYNIDLGVGFFKDILLNCSYTGSGKIYWDEANSVSQDYYGLVNTKATLQCKNVGLELWAKNICDKEYGAFYFESYGNSFIQRGRPRTFGATLMFEF
ncbi:MAG: TonB-dependent receptor [Rikenellaceae bacterium]